MSFPIINDEQLRAYTKCSEYFYLGGGDNSNFSQRVVRNAFERLVVRALRDRLKDPVRGVQSCILQAVSEEGKKEQLFESQISRHMNMCLLWMNDMLSIFPLGVYQPVFGRIQPKIRVKKTTIKADISGIFRSAKNQTIHAVTFSPYLTKHAMLNDPTLVLKLLVLKPFVKEHFGKRPQVILHIFGYGQKGDLNYHSINSNNISKKSSKMIQSIVSGIEQGFRYPINPCNYSCQFKTKCYPWIENV